MLTIPDHVVTMQRWHRSHWIDAYLAAAAGLNGTGRSTEDIAEIATQLADNAVRELRESEVFTEKASADYWKPTLPGNARLFHELRQTAEAPEWIPYLPLPGTYQHPLYGDIVMSRERADEFVANFKSGIYQDRIPVDAEHETKVSGAFGWITDMRVNADGSADAQVEWLDRGKAMFEENRFRYFSPEWFNTWTDPATGTTHANVAAGGALTNHPFFKPDSLRPLVASAGQLFVCTQPDGTQREAFTRHTERTAPVADKETTQNTEAQAAAEQVSPQAFADLTAKLTALQSLTETQKAALEAKDADLTAATERITRIEADGRRKTFNDMVLGRGGAQDGKPWVGEVDKHVTFMESLVTAFGADSDELKTYQEMQRATAEQASKSALFASIGSGNSGSTGTSAWDEIETKAKARMASEPTLSFAQAVDAVTAADQELSRRYSEESRA